MPLDLDESLWAAISASAIAGAVREMMWLYPLLETLHILGLALLFGSIFAFDLRVLGVGTGLPVATLGRHLKPWVWTGFVLCALTGTLMFASDASEFAPNPALQAKLLLIGFAGLNAAYFETRVAPDRAPWGPEAAPWQARLSATLSIALWLSIIVAGRMIAYIK